MTERGLANLSFREREGVINPALYFPFGRFDWQRKLGSDKKGDKIGCFLSKAYLSEEKKCGFGGHRMKRKEKNKIVCVSAPMVKKQTNK